MPYTPTRKAAAMNPNLLILIDVVLATEPNDKNIYLAVLETVKKYERVKDEE